MTERISRRQSGLRKSQSSGAAVECIKLRQPSADAASMQSSSYYYCFVMMRSPVRIWLSAPQKPRSHKRLRGFSMLKYFFRIFSNFSSSRVPNEVQKTKVQFNFLSIGWGLLLKRSFGCRAATAYQFISAWGYNAHLFARFFETLKKIRIRENVPDGCIQDKYLFSIHLCNARLL